MTTKPTKRDIAESDLTSEDIRYIREQYDQYEGEGLEPLIKGCQLKTHLSKPTIETIIEAYKNDFYRKSKGGQKNSGSRFHKLTDEMKIFLIRLDEDMTGREKQHAFNEEFEDADFTPLSRRPVLRYRSKLLKGNS